MDEYSILKKKRQKNAFAATALLISIAIALLVMVGAVLVLGKVNNDTIATSDDSIVEKISNDSTTCEGLVSEIVFNDNLKTIKEAAISYFTNERLPQTVGETKKITLKEMQDQKLVLNVRDASANSCDASKSYVEVTKEENEYMMKVFLSCNDLEDYIIVHLGCYDYCDKDVCEKKVEPTKVFEYEYKKTTSCVMSDWSSWGDWKTTREKTSNLKKEDIKIETSTKEEVDSIDAIANTSYNCDKYPGYTLVGTSCVKETTVTDTKDATPSEYSYNCDKYSGYNLVGKKCVKTTIVKDTIDADKNPITYSCPTGYKLNGKKCERTVSKKITEDATRTCPTGYTLNGTDCIKKTTTTDTKTATRVCASGYTLSGTDCIKKTTSTDTKTATRTCPSGYTLSGTSCNKTVSRTDVIDAEAIYSTRNKTEYYTCYKQECTTKTVFSCPVGQSCGNYPQTSCESVKKTCSKKVSENYISDYKCPDTYTLSETSEGKMICSKLTKSTVATTSSLTCASGYTLSGTKCTKKTTTTDTKASTLTCEKGYTLSGEKCTKKTTTTDTKASTLTCASGYTLSGEKCTKKTTTTDTKASTLTCPSGYTLSGEKCTKTYQEKESINASVDPTTYSCKSDYTLNGTKCTKETTVTDTKNATKVAGGYVCEDGYTQNDKTCTKITVNKDVQDATKKVTYSCQVGYTQNDKTCSRKTTKTIKTTYYRYATRSCNGGSTSIKWSTSNNDSILKGEGYKLTGNKREVKEIVK